MIWLLILPAAYILCGLLNLLGYALTSFDWENDWACQGLLGRLALIFITIVFWPFYLSNGFGGNE